MTRKILASDPTQDTLSTKTRAGAKREEMRYPRQVSSTGLARVCRSKSTPTTIKRGSSQGEKTHQVSDHSNTHLKPENFPFGNSFFPSIIFYPLFSSLLLHQFLYPFSSVRSLMAMRGYSLS